MRGFSLRQVLLCFVEMLLQFNVIKHCSYSLTIFNFAMLYLNYNRTLKNFLEWICKLLLTLSFIFSCGVVELLNSTLAVGKARYVNL
jgi:hypothetical protein